MRTVYKNRWLLLTAVFVISACGGGDNGAVSSSVGESSISASSRSDVNFSSSVASSTLSSSSSSSSTSLSNVSSSDVSRSSIQSTLGSSSSTPVVSGPPGSEIACGDAILKTVELADGIYDSGIYDGEERLLRYRYALPADYDPEKEYGVSLNLHGNSSETQEQALGTPQPFVENHPRKGQLIRVTLASPGVRFDGVTREWDYEKDSVLLNRLLTNDFSCQINVDKSKVYLHGISQGGCFVNAFLGRHGNNLTGGGALVECGCADSLEMDWIPTQTFIDNFRIFISSTTGDFLYDTAVYAGEYYRNHIGLEQIVANTEDPGAHCQAPRQTINRAWEYLTEGEEIDPAPRQVIWERMGQLAIDLNRQKVAGFTLSSDEELVVAVYDSQNRQSTVYLSADKGVTWTPQGTIGGEIVKLYKKGDALWYVLTKSELLIGASVADLVPQPRFSNLLDLWSSNSEEVYFSHFSTEKTPTITGNVDSASRQWTDVFNTWAAFYDANVSLSPLLPQKNTVIFTAFDGAWSLYNEVAEGDYGELTLPAPIQQGYRLKITQVGSGILATGLFKEEQYFGAYYSANGGDSWTKLTLPEYFSTSPFTDSTANPNFVDVALLPDQSIILLTRNKMFYSQDHSTWDDWNSFLRSYEGMAIDENSRLYTFAGKTLYRATFNDFD